MTSAIWHETDMPKYLSNVRYWVNSGKHLLSLSFSSFDPQQTFNGDAKLALGSVQLLRIRYGVANRPKR